MSSLPCLIKNDNNVKANGEICFKTTVSICKRKRDDIYGSFTGKERTFSFRCSFDHWCTSDSEASTVAGKRYKEGRRGDEKESKLQKEKVAYVTQGSHHINFVITPYLNQLCINGIHASTVV